MSYYSERTHGERSWYALQAINSEIIEQRLRGQLTPSRESVIRLLNERRKRKEVWNGIREKHHTVHRKT